ncbi:efflux RND transporter periplasmic adaptor subunit [Tenacibaculum discolor]|uniref:Efflux RND transporter periplasmic adaptor subunit n=1 Tax=Tenacibaculum discolor TaxID=361581 RepID=A0A2G1BSL3_9FLAO|nr:efflux RND transporter periplasmic adaptor subunit [Tenacibaculum discolor]MDP2542414.1 efflux RND transporter periplasmic adaptor subunit [Tenacibaculum discolor]PHN96829.1 efflux transporter periplasmic adaptor subunit [Tenacibaculum discolor]PHO01253.1 efflux transporter periplasmic adaptor subunit [Rhodobacteraceae bacterium 4F10]
MRKIYSLFAITLLLASCGGKKEQSVQDVIASNDLAKIREKKASLDTQMQTLSDEIKVLNDKISELDTNKKVPLITVLSAKEEVFDHYLELQGAVQTKQNVLIYPEMPGLLTRVYVKEGQYVKKGQTLAKIDDGGLANQLAQIEAQAALAETTYKRQKRLWEQKIGSEIQFLQAKTNYEAQTNAVSQLRRQLAKSVITAPFSGVIDDVIKEQGTVVAPGMGSEVFRIVNLKNMYIETDVPESYITSIKKGKNVEVEFPVLGEKLTSKIRQAGNFINPANRTFKVEVGVPNHEGKIKPNLTAKLRINDYSNEKAILIPQSIISENANGEQYVYVVENIKDQVGTAKQIIITTGKTQGDIIEVLSGIENGTKIIEEGARSVKNGQEVKVLTLSEEAK